MKLTILSLLAATAFAFAGATSASAAPASPGGVLEILGAAGTQAEPVRCRVRRVRVCERRRGHHRPHCRMRTKRVCW
jgi:hypothetical protein